METTKKRENWSSRIGFIMASAGSAIGLGNIWRFPYMVGDNGGGAFLIVYLICSLTIGLSVMIGEFTLGRRSGLAAVGAFKKYNRNFTFVGFLGVLSAFLIMGFYPVVGGWSLAYIFKSFTGLLADSSTIGDAFGAFITSPVEPIIWTILFLIMNLVIVAKGIASGIEKAGKILMPALFVILLLIAVKSLSLAGASEGLKFLFMPDFSKLSGKTVLAALGQAFFSLSLGMGIMITYGSYLSKDEDLKHNATIVTLLDTGIALLAGIAIFPALFAFGMEPTQGPGLVFVVVPQVFAAFGALGPVFSALFFVALTVAALTSSISLLEAVVAYLIDERNVPRKKAVTLSSAIMVITCILSSLSLGAMSGVKIFGVGFFDLFDILTDKIFMALAGMIICIFIGWFMKKEDIKDEVTSNGKIPFSLFEIWYFLIKFIIPIAVAAIAFSGMKSIEHRELLLFGLSIVGLSAIFSRKI